MEFDINEIQELSFEFVLKLIEFTEELEQRGKYEVATQLLKSGTLIGATIREAQIKKCGMDLESTFIVACKEAEKTEYFLFLCERSQSYPDPGELLEHILTIKKLLSQVISTLNKKG